MPGGKVDIKMDDGRAHREEEGEILHREDVEDRSSAAGAEMPVETSDARAINLLEERFYAAHRSPMWPPAHMSCLQLQ